jgi:hypothetical protein
MLQAGSEAAVAVPAALHVIVAPLSVPSALPVSFRSPAHVALNEPFADDDVSSVGVHLKSVHVDDDGMAPDVADVQVPISAAIDVALGLVTVVLFS